MITYAIKLVVDENSLANLSIEDQKEIIRGNQVYNGKVRYYRNMNDVYEVFEIPDSKFSIYRLIGKIVEV